jgi:hypothetical protein
MNKSNYKTSLALEEHMLSGERVSIIEANIVFGVQSFNRTLTSMKRNGRLIKTQKVPMAKVIRRLNNYCLCKPPKELPLREILVSEYWISQ